MSVALAGAQVCKALYNFAGSAVTYLYNSHQPKVILKTTPVALGALKNFTLGSTSQIWHLIRTGGVLRCVALGVAQSATIGILTSQNHPYIKVGYLGLFILLCAVDKCSCIRNVRNPHTGQKDAAIMAGATLGALSDYQNRWGFEENQHFRTRYSILPEDAVLYWEAVSPINAICGAFAGDISERMFTVFVRSITPISHKYRTEVAIAQQPSILNHLIQIQGSDGTPVFFVLTNNKKGSETKPGTATIVLDYLLPYCEPIAS